MKILLTVLHATDNNVGVIRQPERHKRFTETILEIKDIFKED
jgi:hypothetical protein